jgi:DNA-binding MarR family transcriptional regulator
MKKTAQYITKSWQDSLEPLAEDIHNCAMKLQTDLYLNVIYFAATIATNVQKHVDMGLIERSANRKDFRVLHTLIMNGGRMRPTEIGKGIWRSKCAITRVVDSLEERGLVKREPFGDDLRTKDITITKRGLELVNSYTDYVTKHIIPQVLGNLDEKQIKELIYLFKNIGDHLSTHYSDVSKKQP